MTPEQMMMLSKVMPQQLPGLQGGRSPAQAGRFPPGLGPLNGPGLSGPQSPLMQQQQPQQFDPAHMAGILRGLPQGGMFGNLGGIQQLLGNYDMGRNIGGMFGGGS